MTSAGQLPVTSKLRDANARINLINVQKFPMLLTRIIAKLHLRNQDIFNEAELEQLCHVFSLSDGDLKTVLRACGFFFQQAAYHTIHPNKLRDQLIAADMDEEHAQAVATVWAAEASGLVDRLKEQTMSGPSTLTSSQYRLHLMMGDSHLTRLKEPSALFEYALGRHQTEAAASSAADGQVGSAESVVVEYSHAELYDFFLKLEQVQEQLDSLN